MYFFRGHKYILQSTLIICLFLWIEGVHICTEEVNFTHPHWNLSFKLFTLHKINVRWFKSSIGLMTDSLRGTRDDMNWICPVPDITLKWDSGDNSEVRRINESFISLTCHEISEFHLWIVFLTITRVPLPVKSNFLCSALSKASKKEFNFLHQHSLNLEPNEAKLCIKDSNFPPTHRR